jgi:hypothetical protein
MKRLLSTVLFVASSSFAFSTVTATSGRHNMDSTNLMAAQVPTTSLNSLKASLKSEPIPPEEPESKLKLAQLSKSEPIPPEEPESKLKLTPSAQ